MRRGVSRTAPTGPKVRGHTTHNFSQEENMHGKSNGSRNRGIVLAVPGLALLLALGMLAGGSAFGPEAAARHASGPPRAVGPSPASASTFAPGPAYTPAP